MQEDGLKLSKEQKEATTAILQKYFKDELDTELSGLQASFLMDFIAEKFGPYFYNLAIGDAIKFMQTKADDLYLYMKDE